MKGFADTMQHLSKYLKCCWEKIAGGFSWATFLFPVLLLCLAAVVVNLLDRVFVTEYPHRTEYHFLCASIIGLASDSASMGPLRAATAAFPGRMITGSAESVVHWFKWAYPARDSAVATRELTARLIVEITDFAVGIAALVTIVNCLRLICRSWAKMNSTQKWWIVGATLATSVVIYILWFSSLQPFEHSLPNALTAHAVSITDRELPGKLNANIQLIVILVALPLAAMTSSCIIAAPIVDAAEKEKQLNDLTSLLMLTAVLVVLYTFMVGSSLLWAGSLLPQGKDSDGSLVQQLALAMAINFGVFFTFLLAAFHIPAVWAVSEKPCAVSAGAVPSPTQAQYYIKVGTILSPLLAGIPMIKMVGLIFSSG